MIRGPLLTLNPVGGDVHIVVEELHCSRFHEFNVAANALNFQNQLLDDQLRINLNLLKSGD